ncbi:BatD family protein, partial [Candidatus Dependentiae bacterium]|nr:BatD family protein [Candidatus Dependentiae bacterium]
MITKIGKKLLMLSVASAGLLSGSMTLEITNTLGIPLTSINVGAPFFVIISLKGTVPDRWPVIDSLDKVHIVGQRTEAKTREGSPADRDEKKLIYTVIADKPGALSLGPAHSGMQRSNAKTISVVEGHYPSASSTLKPSYTISIPSKHYVVGERIPFTLTFSTRREESKLAHLETLHGEGIKGEILTTGEAKVIASNGELTSVIEYKGYFYAAKTGELILRPLRADYT